MPRTARLNRAGGVFHVISRCLGGVHLFKGDAERAHYLACLGRAASRTDALILSYCIMSNHVHLVVVQGTDPLERLMKSTHTAFSGWLNRGRRRGKSLPGPVFGDRPHMVLVQEETHLLELVRYVHNNPVRAGLVGHARDSNWSSHRAFVRAAQAPDFLKLGYVLERFGKRDAARRFDAFVVAGEKEPRRSDLTGDAFGTARQQSKAIFGDGHRPSDAIVGDVAFVARVKSEADEVRARLSGSGLPTHRGDAERVRPLLSEVQDAVCADLTIEPWQFEAQPKQATNALARRLIAWIWVHHFGGKQIEIARALRVPTSTAARWYARAAQNAPVTEQHASGIVAKLTMKPRRGKGQPLDAPSVWFTVDVR